MSRTDLINWIEDRMQGVKQKKYKTRNISDYPVRARALGLRGRAVGSNESSLIAKSISLCVRRMNQENWGMCENHGYNHYSNNSCDDEFYNNGCDYGDQYESHDNGWQWTDNPGQNQYQESPFFSENQYQNQYQESPFFLENQYQESHDNDWQWTDNSGQNQYQESSFFTENQYQESPYFSETQEDSNEHYFNDKWERMCSFTEMCSNQMMDEIEKSRQLQEISLSNIQKSLEYISEQLNQPPPGNPTDTTQLEEVSFLCHDEPFDNKEHEPTPPLVEVVMKDYVSLDDTDSESDFENKEVLTDLENSNKTFHDLETPNVWEGSVEANTNPDPTELKACEKQKRVLLFELTNDPPSSDDTLESCLPCFRTKALECQVMEGLVEINTTSSPTIASKPDAQPFVVIDLKRLFIYKQVKDFINRPFLTTIHAQVSRHKSAIDVIFVNQEIIDILFSSTNNPPITGELLVINTIDDYVHEHTANMLSDTTRTLENCLPCNRSRMMHDFGNPLAMRKRWKKKQDFIFTRRSKAKGRGYKKRRARKFCRNNYSHCSKTRLRCSSAKHKAKRLGPYTDRCTREEKGAKVENPRKTLKSLVALSNEDIAMSKLEMSRTDLINWIEDRMQGVKQKKYKTRNISDYPVRARALGLRGRAVGSNESSLIAKMQGVKQKKYKTRNISDYPVRARALGLRGRAVGSNESSLIAKSISLCVRRMNQENWGMCENHGYNHYSNNSCDDEFYNNGCDYGDQYESHDNGWQWTDNPGQNQYQESPFFSENQYQDQYQESPFFLENQYQESHDNDWQWTDNSGQNQYQESSFFTENQYQESPYFSETQEDSNEHYFNDKWERMCSFTEMCSNQMMDEIEKSRQLQEISLSNIQKSLEYISEQLNQPPPGNPTDTTQLEEVSFLCHDEPFDNKEHEPTPPLVEVVMKDYVSLDDTDSESDFENKEVLTDLENSNKTFHDLETPNVWEGSVEANTNPDPTELKACEKQKRVLLFELTNDPPSSDDTLESCLPCFRTKALECQVMEGLVEINTTSSPTIVSKPDAQPFVVIDLKRLFIYKQVKDFINRPFLTTIHAQVSRHKSAIDVIFINQELIDILFSSTNNPPITGELLVINTIDDYVHEHTANMLSDTTRTLENCLPCNRSRMMHDFGNPLAMRKRWKKKQDFIFTRRSKAKGRGYKKRRARKFCRNNYSHCSKTRLRCSSAKHKAKRLGPYTDRCTREEKGAKVENPRKTLKSLVALSNEDIAMSKLEMSRTDLINWIEDRMQGVKQKKYKTRNISDYPVRARALGLRGRAVGSNESSLIAKSAMEMNGGASVATFTSIETAGVDGHEAFGMCRSAMEMNGGASVATITSIETAGHTTSATNQNIPPSITHSNDVDIQTGTPNESVQICQPINVVAKQLWTPLVEEKPYKGQQFASFESALAYYKEYGRKCGFEIHKATTEVSKGGDGYSRRYIVCNKDGENKKKVAYDSLKDKKKQHRNRPSHRVKCKASVRLKLNNLGIWEITHFEEQHTHDFVKLEDSHFLKSNRRLTYQQKQLLHDVSGINVGPVRAFKVMKQTQGGYENVGASEVECKNFKRDLSSIIGEGDVDLVLEKLSRKREYLPDYTFEYYEDEHDMLSGLFWADEEGKRNYMAFGDAVGFDATNRTNYESKEAYQWLLTCFKNTFGAEPKILMTDQDPAVKEVIPEVFSEAVRHRYCMWHISQKFTKKLSKTDVLNRQNDLIWDERLTPEIFEKGWQSIMDDYDLHTNSWFSDMYEARSTWIPAYFKDYHYSGLMRTTSRSECENRFFGSLTNTDMHLIEFISNFETAMESQRHVQRKNDHLSRYTTPDNISKLVMEADAIKIFTRSIFYDIQREIQSSIITCYSFKVEDMGDTTKFSIKDTDTDLKRAGEYEVMFVISNTTIRCSCSKFETTGKLCRHCFYVLRMSGVEHFPAKYVSTRWRKEVVPRSCSDIIKSKGPDDIQRNELKKYVDEDTIGEDPMTNKEFIETVIGVRKRDDIKVRIPEGVRTKGSKKRLISEKEKAILNAKKGSRRCGGCVNHNITALQLRERNKKCILGTVQIDGDAVLKAGKEAVLGHSSHLDSP
ncbi:hypothetical protein LXL04_022825 [Taraxacum kok-saghyz]